MTRENHAVSAASLQHQRRLAHAPAKVWAALTEPDQLAVWMMASEASIEPRLGGRVEIRGHVHFTGRILAFEPLRVLEHEFQVAPGEGFTGEEDAVVRYELEADGDGTLLTVSFRRASPTLARVFMRGQARTFDRLEALLEGRL